MTLTLPTIVPSAGPSAHRRPRPTTTVTCDRCRARGRLGALTAYAGEHLCLTCLVRVRDLTCRYCGQLKPADPRRELCDSCVAHGFGSY